MSRYSRKKQDEVISPEVKMIGDIQFPPNCQVLYGVPPRKTASDEYGEDEFIGIRSDSNLNLEEPANPVKDLLWAEICAENDQSNRLKFSAWEESGPKGKSHCIDTSEYRLIHEKVFPVLLPAVEAVLKKATALSLLKVLYIVGSLCAGEIQQSSSVQNKISPQD